MTLQDALHAHAATRHEAIVRPYMGWGVVNAANTNCRAPSPGAAGGGGFHPRPVLPHWFRAFPYPQHRTGLNRVAHYNLDAPRIGTIASLKPYRRVDSRSCFQCGARAGACEHLAADEDIVWMATSKERPHSTAKVWPNEERERVRRMFRAGMNASEIADIMNTTRAAVCGVLKRLGERRV